MIDISIIIPHYNSVNSLKRLIETIPLQANIQTIIVDDKSDKDIEKLDLLKEELSYRENVVFLENKTTKKGAGVCRNIGIENAEGKWLLFADSDDFFTENFHETVNKYLAYDYDVVFFRPTSIEEDTGNTSNRHHEYEALILNYLNKRDLESELNLRFKFFVPWSKMIKREFVEKHKICFDEIAVSNDVMFSTKVGFYMKNYTVSECIIYCVTRNSGTLTTNINSDLFDIRLKTHIVYYNFLRDRLDSEQFHQLRLKGLGFIINAHKYKLGIKKILYVVDELKNNKIKIINFKDFNPFILFKKIRKHFIKFFYDKKYIKK